MSKVFASLGMSLDGFIAGPDSRPDNPLGDGATRIHEWVFGVEGRRDPRSWKNRSAARSRSTGRPRLSRAA